MIAHIAQASAAQVEEAVNAADKAFIEWGQTTPKDRAALLLQVADVIEEQGEVLARLESQNCGKPYQRVLEDEIPAIADVFRFFAGATRCLSGPVAGEYLPDHVHDPSRSCWGDRVDRAVELSINDGGMEISPALAAGNTVVLKPSEQTPLTAFHLSQTLADLSQPVWLTCYSV